ncbi:hypothetical protein SAMN05421788_105276 [Filimonas lacunae]|uniref:3-oxoacyl-ACP synthase n=2 Tax=Filimonas lacunae TaxID=477680 RepID=A0A173MCI9_9BACT|nr:hypothetical protein FLA_1272 [Filimonas lacunae]SIT22315.1 hypothetical protein SAMN05421788_105276 [Filimonas lacunae]
MTREEQIAFKHSLKQYCEEQLTQRIQAIQEKIEQAQQSANSEEKSSAGDKYETSRAMNHLEKDMHSRQLAQNTQEMAALHAVNTSNIYAAPASGAYIQCKDFSFFIAIGLGKRAINGQTIFFLSADAPITRQLLQKKAGDTFLFNNAHVQIEGIF